MYTLALGQTLLRLEMRVIGSIFNEKYCTHLDYHVHVQTPLGVHGSTWGEYISDVQRYL